MGEAEPGTDVTLHIDTLKPLDHGKKRVGRPRPNWYGRTIADLWDLTRKSIESVKYASELNFDNVRHVAAIKEYSKQQYEKHLKKRGTA